MPKTDVLSLNLLNKIIICFILLKALSFGRAFSQSIISNGDFHSISDCPQFWSQKAQEFKTNNWWSPTLGTPDTYNPCSKMCGTLSNWLGGVPETNNGYIGLVIQSFNKNAETLYREYVQTQLTQSLIKDSSYTLSLDIFFPVNCQFITTDFGVLFSEFAIKSNTEGILPIQKNFPQAISIPSTKKGQWHKVTHTFVANGQERFLTIGNFLYAMTNPVASEGSIPLSYLFIDNVVLVPSGNTSTQLSKKVYPNRGLTFSVGKVFDLDGNETTDQVHNKDTAHAYCSCVNCMRLRGELDPNLTKLEALTDFEVKEGQRIDLNEILFDVSTGAIRPESRVFLNNLIFFLTEIDYADLRFVVYTYESNPNGEAIAKETSLNLYHLLRKSGISNKITFLHNTKNSLSRLDGLPTDRSIELHIVKINK